MQPTSAPPSDSALRLAVDLRRLPWMRRLALDYAFDHARVASFYAGDPADEAAWADTIARVQAHDRPRVAIAAALDAQLAAREAPAEARAGAARLADPSAVAIVTGQQAGLFGGPLFTLLKAITAVRLARRVERTHGVPAVPVFWIDAEDHDWAEIAGCGVFDAQQAHRAIAVEAPPGAGERTVASLTYGDAVREALAALEGALPPTEFTPWLLETLGRAYQPGRGVAEAFGRWLDAVLGPLGLVVFDAADRAFKPFAAPLFRTELEHPGRTAGLAAAAGAEMVARGYHMQVSPAEGSVALFEIDGGRRPIRPQGAGFLVGDTEIPAAALVARAGETPQAFSPNVLLRPLVQDTIFPTLGYVAGPNELAYLGQLRGVYETFGVPMPLMCPRATATILDSAGVRFLKKYRVPLEQLQAQDEAALNELLRAQLPPAVERSLQEAEQAIEERMAAVLAAVPAIDPTLAGAARSTLGKLQHDLRTLNGKVVQAAKRRDETLRRQFMHVRDQAFPHGEPQERSVGFVSFLNRFGAPLVDRLVDELPLDAGTHWVVTI